MDCESVSLSLEKEDTDHWWMIVREPPDLEPSPWVLNNTASQLTVGRKNDANSDSGSPVSPPPPSSCHLRPDNSPPPGSQSGETGAWR